MALLSHFLTEEAGRGPSFRLISVQNRIQKCFVIALTTTGALFGFFLPILASASIFSSLLSASATPSYAASSQANSQTMTLLAPATNLDPKPSMGGGDINVTGGSALVAQEGPSGTAADIQSQPVNPQISVYTVHEGDTLSGIADMFNVNTKTIIGANDIKGGIVHPGQTLVILPIPGILHTVIKGETLSSLAKRYNSDAHDIALYNDMSDDEALTVGDVILIPNAEVAPTPAPTKTKTPAKSKIKLVEPYLGGSGPVLDGYFGWPVAGGVITQTLHGWNGVDIGAPKGTTIYAAAGGTVIVANGNGAWNGGYGSYIVIQHANGTQTLYSHLSRVSVSPGVRVDKGDAIGKVGSTGESTGPHLHFEVRGAKNPFASLSVGSAR